MSAAGEFVIYHNPACGTSRNVLAMIAAGGNIYYLAKLAGIFGLGVQDVGAQQTGMTVEAFKEKLVQAGLEPAEAGA